MADITITLQMSDDLFGFPPPLPIAVTLQSYTILSGTQYQLLWVDMGLYAAHYEIEVSLAANFSGATLYTITGAPQTASFYNVTVPNTAITHYMRIRATNITGASAWVSF